MELAFMELEFDFAGDGNGHGKAAGIEIGNVKDAYRPPARGGAVDEPSAVRCR